MHGNENDRETRALRHHHVCACAHPAVIRSSWSMAMTSGFIRIVCMSFCRRESLPTEQHVAISCTEKEPQNKTTRAQMETYQALWYAYACTNTAIVYIYMYIFVCVFCAYSTTNTTAQQSVHVYTSIYIYICMSHPLNAHNKHTTQAHIHTCNALWHTCDSPTSCARLWTREAVRSTKPRTCTPCGC